VADENQRSQFLTADRVSSWTAGPKAAVFGFARAYALQGDTTKVGRRLSRFPSASGRPIWTSCGEFSWDASPRLVFDPTEAFM